VQDHIGFLAHGTQDLAAGERGTDSVSIRTRVRSQQESVALLDLFENLAKHFLPDAPIDLTVELSAPFLITFQQLINSGRVRLRAVQLKIQLWRTAQVQTLSHFTADETNCCRQSLQRALGFFVIPFDNHENPGGP
jgi:hypothetical protein